MGCALSNSRLGSGLLFGLAAYGLWGLFPLYFSLLDAVSPVEVVAHRVLWSLAFLLILLGITRGWHTLKPVLRSRRALALLAVASVAIAINWTTYVYSVATAQMVEASLGYYINPLVTVLLGVVVLRERLRMSQSAAIVIAAVGVVVIGVGVGAPPWIGLTLAFTFGAYGLLKKLAGVDAIPSLTVETAVLLPVAAVVLAVGEVNGTAAFVQDGIGISILLLLLGPITAIPLLAYGAAANRLPLTTLGIMQYLTPSILLMLGIVVFGETVSTPEWIGFGLIWLALTMFSLDALRHARSSNRADRLEVVEPT